MGYRTTFDGGFKLDRVLTLGHKNELVEFAACRHEGPDYPGIWCDWVPSEDGTAIVPGEAENFYGYVPWIEYLIEHFLGPWGYVLNGRVHWDGEQTGDSGVIRITDNRVESAPDVVTNPLDEK